MLNFLTQFFSLASLASSPRVILSVGFGIVSVLLTVWGWGSDNGGFLAFGLLALVLGGAAAGHGAKCAGAAMVVGLVYFISSNAFTGSIRQMEENQKVMEDCLALSQGEQLTTCP